MGHKGQYFIVCAEVMAYEYYPWDSIPFPQRVEGA